MVLVLVEPNQLKIWNRFEHYIVATLVSDNHFLVTCYYMVQSLKSAICATMRMVVEAASGLDFECRAKLG